MVIKITKNNLHDEVIESEKPVLLDFWATWCGPCQMLAPVVEEVAAERPDITVGKINIDEEPELATVFRIDSIPTLILMDHGEAKAQSIGYVEKAAVLNLLK